MGPTTILSWRWAGVVCLLFAAGAQALGAQREGAISSRSETGDRRAEAAAPDSIDGRTKLGAAGPSAEGQIPRLMKFSGLVRDLAGKPLTGPTEVTFALYSEEAGGAPLWFETQTVEADSLGHYAALLGAMTPAGLPAALFTSAEAHWLGVQAGNLPEQARVLLVSVPYALKAADAETLGGKPASAFQLAPSESASSADDGKKSSPSSSDTASGTGKKAVTGSSTGTKALTTTGPSTFSCSSTTPCVSVSQSSTGIGTQSAAKTLGLYGVATQTTGTTYGVRGSASSTTGRGVFGYASATTGGTIGVYGLAPSTSGVAVLGDANATTGATRGVIGRTSSTSGIGVWGYATKTSGTTTGVRGDVWSLTGTAGYFDNRAGGKILSGRVNGVEKFSVAGNGNVVSGGSLTGTQLISTASTGTSPLTVGSTTLVPNLNADLLDGLHGASFATLGANLFVGDQIITGNLGISGSINSGLRVVDTGGTGFPSVIGGFAGNDVTPGVAGAVLAGGGSAFGPNHVTDDFGFVGGGSDNTAGDGLGTTSDATHATVSGGIGNDASATYATVAGGQDNTASGDYSTIGGGGPNGASGNLSTVGGGYDNIASGDRATVPGGSDNTAQGSRSFAAGCGAKALHDGAFVWSDAAGDCANPPLVSSTAANQFIVRATGGITLYSNFGLTTGCAIAAGGGSWGCSSDRNTKANFREVDGPGLLALLAAIPILSWNFKSQDASIRHMGPMAQDFYAALGLGEDDKHITTIDADGVALAAIQALYRQSLEKDEQIRKLTQKVAELQRLVARMALLEAQIARVRAAR